MKKIIILAILALTLTNAIAQITIAEKTVMREKADIDVVTQNNIAIIAKRTNDNNILIVRSFHRNSLQSLIRNKSRYDSASVTKYDLNGVLLWQKRFGFTGSGSIADFEPTADGGYLFCGDRDVNNFILKMDGSGNVLGGKDFSNTNNNIFFNKITELTNGDYAIASIQYDFVIALPESSYYSWWFPSYGYRHYYNVKYNLGVTDIAGNVKWSIQVASSDENYYQNGMFEDRTVPVDRFSPKLNVNIYAVKTDNVDYVDIAVNSNDYFSSVRTKSILRYNMTPAVVGNKVFDQYNNSSRYNALGYWKVKDGYLFLTDSTMQGVYKSYFVKMDLYGQIKGYYQTEFLDREYGRNLEFAQIHINSDSTIFLFEKGAYSNNKLVRCFKDLSVDWNYSLPYVPEREYGNLLVTEAADHNLIVVSNEYSYDQWEYIKFYKLSADANELHYQVYVDRNGNDRYDDADTAFNECTIYQVRNGVTQQFQPDYYGKYEMFVDTGRYISYIQSFNQSSKYYVFPNKPDTTVFTNYNQEDTVYFKLVKKAGVRDLQIDISQYMPARPGFSSSYMVNLANIGTATVKNVHAYFIKDPLQSFDTLYNTFPTLNDTMYIDFDSMETNTAFYYLIYVNNPPPPDIQGGDTLHLGGIIYPIVNDIYPDDNIFIMNQVVVNSYDPNDKAESHGAGITPKELQDGEYLYYTIRFQNTGNYYASIIKIVDTLSDKLDWSTLEVLTNSHNLEFKVEDGRYLTWWSNNFYLPDSTSDEPGSNGFVSYRIKPKASMQETDVIENTAHIHLDYNPSIATNTVTTRIIQERITSVPHQKEIVKGIKLYPSPTDNSVTLNFDAENNQLLNLKVFDVNGQEMYSEEIKPTAGSNTINIRLSEYANGIYFIRLIADNKELYYGKVLKQ